MIDDRKSIWQLLLHVSLISLMSCFSGAEGPVHSDFTNAVAASNYPNESILSTTGFPDAGKYESGLEVDVAPRPGGDGDLAVNDWVQVGRFVAGLDEPLLGSEFQRADCAPLASSGDGVLLANDWVQAGRFVAGLDVPQPQAGPAGMPIVLIKDAHLDTVECSETFADPGAVAYDADGTPLTVETGITLESTPVSEITADLSTLGAEYVITYSAQPEQGDTVNAIRSVHVVDTVPPTIVPTRIQENPNQGAGYRDFVFVWAWPSGYHFHEVSCMADWPAIDSGTALDTCGTDGPVDYWGDVTAIVRPLSNKEDGNENARGKEIVYTVEEFTAIPGEYQIDYIVEDGAGNITLLPAHPDERYVRVLDTTIVPGVSGVGMTISEAQDLLEYAKLPFDITEVFYDDAAAGIVIAQQPEGGDAVPCGTLIALTVSAGPCQIPDLAGFTEDAAQTAIENSGYALGTIYTIPSVEAAGIVVGQNPAPGTPSACGSTIDITLSEGPCTLQNLTGANLSDALNTLLTSGFTSVTVTHAWDSTPAETVFSQVPFEGNYPCNIPIALFVSFGPEPSSIVMNGSETEPVECGALWTDPGAYAEAGGEAVSDILFAVEVAYFSGTSWEIVDPMNIPLTIANSPYRAEYRYQYEQPDTEAPGELHAVRWLEVVDTVAPLLLIEDNPSYYFEEGGIYIYTTAAGEFSGWDEAKEYFGINVLDIEDACDGNLPLSEIIFRIIRIYPEVMNPDFPGQPLIKLIDTIGLSDTTWLNAPGAFGVLYQVWDTSGNRGVSERFVVVEEIPESGNAGIKLYGESPFPVQIGSNWELVRPELASYDFIPAAGAFAWDDDELNSPLAIISEVLTDKNNDMVGFSEVFDSANTPYMVTYTSESTTNSGEPLTAVRQIHLSSDSK